MATSITSVLDDDSFVESDYGSDFSIGEEGIVNQLLDNLGGKCALPSKTTGPASSPPQFVIPGGNDAQALDNQSIISNPPTREPEKGFKYQQNVSGLRNNSAGVRFGTINGMERSGDSTTRSTAREPRLASLGSIHYPDLSHALQPGKTLSVSSKSKFGEPSQDSRSPLQRFRSIPKKPLSVSDLASGAWCELQYWYTLTRLPGGRKTTTAAMRGGTRIHQTLEDEVHTTVQININTKEEAFALRLWNVIQGLRTLRDSGITRELEVWGVIEGQVVNGIIDELSTESPNAAFEHELNLSQSKQTSIIIAGQPEQQTFIKDFLGTRRRKVYLTDVKTRGSDRLPTGPALRPARVQLFLYHRLLGEMASGVLDFGIILDRYGLRPDALFSDAFMAQVGDLHDEIFYDADSDLGGAPSSPRSFRDNHIGAWPDESQSSESTSPPDLIRYRSITQILTLLRSELCETFPQGVNTLGDLLAVQYRHRDDGRILGNNSFPNDPEALEGYVKQYLKWWRGEREAEGVAIEEAYKCRMCEFAESCQWRKDREAEILQRRQGAARAWS